MPIDAGVFNNIKTFADYQRADQDFQMRRALAAQQLQTGGIDAASKANAYKTQLLSGAAAGGQQAYDQARQTLQGQGIDTSEYAPDVGTANAQLQSARLAQSPLGSLLNAGLKMDSNDIARAGITGVLPAGSNVPAIAAGILPNAAPTAGQAAPPSVAQPQQDAPYSVTDVMQARTAMDNGQMPAPPASVQNLPVSAPANTAAISPRFSPPAQNPNETLPAYNARAQRAFEAYKTDPKYLQASKAAEKTGELSAVDQEAANKAQELTNRLKMNLEAMQRLNPDVPSAGIFPESLQEYGSQVSAAHPNLTLGMGDNGKGVTAANQWDQINNQQVISEIQQFLASGGANTRINQTLDRIMRAASAVDKSGLPNSRSAQINNALAEISNKNVSGQNLAATTNGAPKQEYSPIPVQTPLPDGVPQGASLYGTSQGKKVYKMPDGSFIMEQ